MSFLICCGVKVVKSLERNDFVALDFIAVEGRLLLVVAGGGEFQAIPFLEVAVIKSDMVVVDRVKQSCLDSDVVAVVTGMTVALQMLLVC